MAGLSHGRLQACGVRRESAQPDVEETLAQRRSQACLATPSTPVSAEAIPVSAASKRAGLDESCSEVYGTLTVCLPDCPPPVPHLLESVSWACPDLGKHAVAMCFPDPPHEGKSP